MYSLPITTFSDYLRKTKAWSTYLGGTVVLLAGTGALNQPLNSERFPVPLPIRKTVQPVAVESGRSLTNEAETGAGKGTTEIKTEDVEISYAMEYVESKDLPPGMSSQVEAGEPGIVRNVIRITNTGGREEREVVYSFPLKSPKKKVLIQNSRPVTGEKFDLSKLRVSRDFVVEATAYTYTGDNTATGVPPREGLIAVDPKIIPLGSRVYVEGYGYAVAADTGGDIKGNRVDVFFPSLRQCLDWGRRPARVFVLSSKKWK